MTAEPRLRPQRPQKGRRPARGFVLPALLAVLAVLPPPPAGAGEFLNLDFEVTSGIGRPKGWYLAGPGFDQTTDPEVVHSGERSLRIRRVGEGEFGVATAGFPVEEARGRHLRLTGYIRTEGVAEGYAGLWLRVDGPEGMLSLDNMEGRGPSGSTEWKRYVIELDVPEEARNIVFGALLPGEGTAWFDGLAVELNGEPYPQEPPPLREPSEAEVAWVRENAVPFATAEPGGDLRDLEPLRAIVGDARIVALGEGTHGTREFFQMKHRITRFLVERMGFTHFAIEANMPEARRVNDYVVAGEGDPAEALAGMYFWTWNTREVLDMIEWMHRSNVTSGSRIQFWGFDLQTPKVAMEVVRDLVRRTDRAYLPELEREYATVQGAFAGLKWDGSEADQERTAAWEGAAARVLEYLSAHREAYLQQEGCTRGEVEWALQCARIVRQGAGVRKGGADSRDAAMARNVEWILDRAPPGSKIVLWAHNGHVSRGRETYSYRPMGSYLDARFGDEMVVFGFGFHDGRYTAVGKDGLGAYGTDPSEPGSAEWVFHRTGLPRLILDLRPAQAGSEGSGWLREEVDFRSIGAVAMDYAFYPTVLPEEYDAIVFFDRSTPTELLPRPGKPTGGE